MSKYKLPGDGADTDNRLNRRSEQECLNILTADDFDIFSGRSGILNFDALTGAFTVGATVTGTGSGHTGVIAAIVIDDDAPTTGYLVLNECSGIFANNDALADAVTGVAVSVDGLSPHEGLWMGFTVISATVFAILTTGQEAKQNVLVHSYSANFKITADLRSIQLTSGAIMAHKINQT